MSSQPTCERCDLEQQLKDCPGIVSFTEVPPSRHAWGDVAACPREGCGRQFLFSRGGA